MWWWNEWNQLRSIARALVVPRRQSPGTKMDFPLILTCLIGWCCREGSCFSWRWVTHKNHKLHVISRQHRMNTQTLEILLRKLNFTTCVVATFCFCSHYFTNNVCNVRRLNVYTNTVLSLVNKYQFAVNKECVRTHIRSQETLAKVTLKYKKALNNKWLRYGITMFD